MTGVARLNLTLACGDYDRTRAIRTGEVKPDGVELNVVTLAPGLRTLTSFGENGPLRAGSVGP